MKSFARFLVRRPILSAALLLVLGVFSGLASTQLALLRQLRAPAYPPGIGSLHYVRLKVKDVRSERRVTLGLAQEITAGAKSIERTSIYRAASALVVDGEWADSLGCVYTEPGIFDTFRVYPLFGSKPDPSRPGAAGQQAVYITHRLWRRLPNADQGVVGRLVTVAGEPAVIAGVLPPGIEIPNGCDVIAITPDLAAGGPGPVRPMDFVIRPAAGASRARVQAELEAILANTSTPIPNRDGVTGLELTPLPAHLLGPEGRRLLYGLTAIAGCFALALLCTAAVLVLLKNEENESAQVIRIVLGADPRRLVLHALAESAGWIAASIPVGVLVAAAYGKILSSAFALAQKQAYWLRFDYSATLFAAFVAIGFFVIAACHVHSVLRLNIDRIKLHQRAVTRGGRSVTAAFLVAAQIFLCIVLVATTLLFTRARGAKAGVAQPLARERVVTFRIALPTSLVPTVDEQHPLLARLREAIRGIPGVADVAFSRRPGYGPCGIEEMGFRAPGTSENATRHAMSFDVISDGYFRALGLRVLEGREFEASDTRRGRAVALVNQAFARRHSPGRSPVGSAIERRTGKYQIVGLVPDLDMGGIVGEPGPAEGVYLHLPQSWRMPYVAALVRFEHSPPGNLDRLFRRAVASVSPGIVPYTMSTVAQFIDEQYGGIDTMRATATWYAAIATGITALAVIAIVLFGVRQAMPELALRMALGATATRALLPLCRWLVVSAAAASAGALLAVYTGHRFIVPVRPNASGVDALALCATGATLLVLLIVGVAVIPGLLRIRRAPLGRLLS